MGGRKTFSIFQKDFCMKTFKTFNVRLGISLQAIFLVLLSKLHVPAPRQNNGR